VQEIGDWLEKLGMPEYGESFAENKLDLSVLPHLTDQDLKDIRVPLGHPRKMLAAIAHLDDTSIAEARVPAPGSLKSHPPPWRRPPHRRRKPPASAVMSQ
jgi:hypothetical protein